MSHAKRIFLPIRQWPAAARTPAALEICAGPIHCLPAVYNNDDAAYRELHFAMPLTDHRLWTATSRDLLPCFPCRTGYPIAFRYRLSTYSPYSLLLFAETYSDLIQIYTSTFFFNLSKGENVRIISGISAVVVNKLVFFFSNQKCRRCKNVGALTFDRSLPHSVIPCTCIHDLINIRPLVSKTGLDNRVSLVYEWNVIVIYAYYACEWNARNSHCVRGGLTVCRPL